MPLLADNIRSFYGALIITALTIAGLVYGRDLLMPLAISTCLTFILSPIVTGLVRWRVPHGAAVTGVIISLVTGLILLSTVFATQVLSLAGDLGVYKANLLEKVRSVTHSAKSDGAIKRATDAIDAIGTDLTKEITKSSGSKPSGEVAYPGSSQPSVIVKVDDGRKDSMLDYLGTLMHPLALGGLTLLFTLFMLLQMADLRDRIIRVAGIDNVSGTTDALNDAASRLSQLFLTQALMNIAFGAVVGVALWLIGVPNSLLWAALTAVMRFVPYVGSLISAIPPVLLAAAVDPGWAMAIGAFAVFAIAEPIMGHIVEPVVLGQKAGLSPFAMLAATSFWALIWGPVGLILAAPLTLTLVVLGRYIKGLEFVTVLLGDEPALSPQEQFYHRLLADDTLGAAQQLEASDSDSNLVTIGDAIVLPALHLAAIDYDRGQFDRSRAEGLLENVVEIAQQFEPADALLSETALAAKTTRANEAKSRGEILVIAARSQIDMAAATFIAQAIEASHVARATVSSRATGLTAISQAMAHVNDIGAVVLVTAGGNDAQYLPLIARRAERAFPAANITILDLSGHPLDDGTLQRLGKARWSAKLVDLIDHLKHAPRPEMSRAS